MDLTQDEEPMPQRRINLLENVQHNPPPPPQKCPRCYSSNTKFCYYNNYSLSQPRYLCKGCRRYWTLGGTLRNVPIGGGCRRNKRLKLPGPPTSTHEIVTRSQPIRSQFAGMGICLRSGMDRGTKSNTNFPYPDGTTLAALRGFSQPPISGRFDRNMAPLHGMNLPPLRPCQSPQQLGNGVFQLPVSFWAQGFRGGVAGSSDGKAGLWDGNDHVGSSFRPNNYSSKNHQGFGPSQRF